MMSHAYQHNKDNSYRPWWISREDTNSETLVKGHLTLMSMKYKNTNLRNKWSHKTRDSYKKLSSLQLHNKSDSKSRNVLMENLHKPSMIKPINSAQIATHAQLSGISSTNISLRFFSYTYALVINESYSNEKLQGTNKLSQITNEYMNLIPWDNLSNQNLRINVK